jgi:transcriptional regulator
MIELRARRKVALASQTLQAYRTTLTDHLVRVPRGTRFYDIPSVVLGEGDRWGVHIRSNIVDIVRMVKDLRPTCLRNGRTTRSISFVFNRAGRLRVGNRGSELGRLEP